MELSRGPAVPMPTEEGSIHFPDGVGVCTEKGEYYISKGKKFKALSCRAFMSWDLPIFISMEEHIAHIPDGGGLGFRDGTFIKTLDGKTYLISNSKKRRFTDPDVAFLRDTEVVYVLVSDDEAAFHKDGVPLD